MANTTTSVVQISVSEESGKTKTFNIDNPKSGLSLSEVRQKLQPAFNGRWWLGNDGTAITTLKSANYSTAQKIPIEGSSENIEIVPASLNIRSSGEVEVTGATVIGAYVTDVPDRLDFNHFTATVRISDSTQKVEISTTFSTPAGINCTLVIVTENGTSARVPVSFIQ